MFVVTVRKMWQKIQWVMNFPRNCQTYGICSCLSTTENPVGKRVVSKLRSIFALPLSVNHTRLYIKSSFTKLTSPPQQGPDPITRT